MHRRKSSGSVVFVLDDIPYNSDITNPHPLTANVSDGLDLNARTALRRKSKGNLSTGDLLTSGGSPSLTLHATGRRGSVPNGLTLSNASGAAGGSDHCTVSRNDSISSDKSDKQTPRSSGGNRDENALVRNNSNSHRRRGSRNGSISGLTAEQAVALSSRPSDSTSTNELMRRDSESGVERGTKSRNNSITRRSSFGGTSISDGLTAALVADGLITPPSTGRRRSFESTPRSRRPSLDGEIKQSNLGPIFEKTLVDSMQKVINATKGRSIPSIRANPSYGPRNATTKRGITLLTNNICLGGRDDASDLAACNKMGITHVLNMATQLPNFQEDHLVCLKIPVKDDEETQITDVCSIASKFISRVEAMNGRVLVHCISGVSRSTTIVLLHLMNEHGFTLKDAYDYVFSCRPWIAPNDGFKLQLCEMELLKFRSSSVAGQNCGPAWNFYSWNSRKATVPQMKQSVRDAARGQESGGCIISIINMLFGG